MADVHDVGADGLPDSEDTGEGDGQPTLGEPNFDRTDLNESDQIGLTGFKLNRIRPGQGNPKRGETVRCKRSNVSAKGHVCFTGW